MSHGAVIDESSITETIEVGPTTTHTTIASGLRAALQRLALAIPVRLRLAPGVYRESVADLRLDAAVVRDTLLVIEAAPGGAVVWSGADPIPDASWNDAGGGLWSTPWTRQWGNFTYPWGEPVGVGPRREMLFLAGEAVLPVALEEYAIEGAAQFPNPGDRVLWARTGARDPRTTLKPGQFGVDDTAQLLWLRLPAGVRPAVAEAATRPVLLDISGKRRLVLRGITFRGCANGHHEMYTHSPVRTGLERKDWAGDILIDRCSFIWNSGTGLVLRGWRWTMRDSSFDHNGNGGISLNQAGDILMERCSTSFNCWREYLAGVSDWCFGGFKAHEIEGHVVRDHVAIGNADHGMWWDVWCKDVTVDGAILVGNRRSMIYELSWGPFNATRVLAVGGQRAQQIDAKSGQPRPDADPVVAVSCSGRSSIRSSIIATDSAPQLYGVIWYERDNDHAKLNSCIPGTHELSSSVLLGGGMVGPLVSEDNVGDRKAVGWRSLQYRGADNLFWHSGGQAGRFSYADAQWQRRAVDLSTWAGLRPETGGRFADPQFIDPQHGDFRVRPGSPLAGRTDLPLQRIDPTLLQRMDRFHAWLGWVDPSKPASPRSSP